MMSIVAMAGSHHPPAAVMMLPFAFLLGAIALAPVIFQHHWERHYHRVCFALAAIVCGYYLTVLHDAARVLHAVLEYASFIVVVGSFYVVAGGIHLRARSAASPATNVVFLFCGALLANVIGTIGASMLLIRPWLDMNKRRFSGMHLAFFVFVISNVGGALLPVGPPLFLGYLNGIPFFWPLLRCWPQWLVAVGALLSIFYLCDRRNLSSSAPAAPDASSTLEKWHVFGKRNLALMLTLLVALVALPPGWREALMLACAVASYRTSPPHVHQANGFSFAPITEVAWLFLGIFGTMIPVLDYMQAHAANLGLRSDAQFFWGTGVLSAVLDNAPSYLALLAAALGLHGLELNNAAQVSDFVAQHDHHLVAISLGATFFGGLTYIGNGPNLLVKAIAQNAGFVTPTFFGFIFKYAAPVLLPVLVLVSILFFR